MKDCWNCQRKLDDPEPTCYHCGAAVPVIQAAVPSNARPEPPAALAAPRSSPQFPTEATPEPGARVRQQFSVQDSGHAVRNNLDGRSRTRQQYAARDKRPMSALVRAAVALVAILAFSWARSLYFEMGEGSRFLQWRKASTIELHEALNILKADLERGNYPSECDPSHCQEQVTPAVAFRFKPRVDLTQNPPGQKTFVLEFHICKPSKTGSENPDDDQQQQRIRALLEAVGRTLRYRKVPIMGSPARYEVCDMDLVHDVQRVTISPTAGPGGAAGRGSLHTLTIETSFPENPARSVSQTMVARIGTLPVPL